MKIKISDDVIKNIINIFCPDDSFKFEFNCIKKRFKEAGYEVEENEKNIKIKEIFEGKEIFGITIEDSKKIGKDLYEVKVRVS